MIKLYRMVGVFGIVGLVTALTRYGWVWVMETCYMEFFEGGGLDV